MQDPLFYQTQDSPMDLHRLFSPDSGIDGAEALSNEGLDASESINESVESMEDSIKTDQIIEESSQDSDSMSELEKKIKAVEEYYQENPISLFGANLKLVRLAKKLIDNQQRFAAKQLLQLI